MKSNLKRFLSLALALVMVIGMMPMQAFAAEDDTCEHPSYQEGKCIDCGAEESVDTDDDEDVDTDDDEEDVDTDDDETPCTLVEGCILGAGHEGECFVWVPCALTEGCELANGHEGECSSAALYEGEEDNVIDTGTELQAALNNGDTVTLNSDVTTTAETVIIVNFGVRVTLDLNGHTIKNTSDNPNAVITNNGDLTIKGNGLITENSQFQAPRYNIYNNGILVIENCSFGNEANYCLGMSSDSITTLNGGTFGNVVGAGELTIAGGTYSSGVSGATSITGGKFTGQASFKPEEKSVTGGTFSWNLDTKYLADGYKLVQTGDNEWTVQQINYVAEANDIKYETLQDAVNAAPENGTVKLLATGEGAGVVIDKSVTIDFAGYTYTLTEPVGSTGTVSNGFQILQVKDGEGNKNQVTLKNGTLNVAEENKDDFYILIQNYTDLTVEDMVLDGTNLDKYSKTDGDSYVLSNNSGEVVVKGNTNITANDDGNKAVAFDSYKSDSYDAPEVTIQTTGRIKGLIESNEGATIVIESGTYTVDPSAWAKKGFTGEDDGYGNWILVEQATGPVTLDISNGAITISATGYSQNNGPETAYTGSYILTGTTAQAYQNITINGVAEGATITLKDLSVTTDGPAPLNINCNADIVAQGSVALTAKNGCAIITQQTLNVAVTGEADITLTGPSVGISGGNWNIACKNLNISATGNYGCAVSGGSSLTVNATGNIEIVSAGIYAISGSNMDVSLTAGGTITVEGNISAASATLAAKGNIEVSGPSSAPAFSVSNTLGITSEQGSMTITNSNANCGTPLLSAPSGNTLEATLKAAKDITLTHSGTGAAFYGKALTAEAGGNLIVNTNALSPAVSASEKLDLQANGSVEITNSNANCGTPLLSAPSGNTLEATLKAAKDITLTHSGTGMVFYGNALTAEAGGDLTVNTKAGAPAVKAEQDITLKAQGDISVTGNFQALCGQNLTVNAVGDVSILGKGAAPVIQATGDLTLQGKTATVERANANSSSFPVISVGGTYTGVQVKVIDNGVESTYPATYVAQIGETKYETLQAAVDAATEGANVTLLQDVTLTETLKLNKRVYIKTDGHSITGDLDTLIEVDFTTGTAFINGGANVTLRNTGDVIYMKNGILRVYGALNIVSENANCVYTRGGTIEIQKANMQANGIYPAIQGNGNYGGNVYLSGAVVVSAPESDMAIYWPQNGTLKIEQGKFIGDTAVYVKSGNVTISGGEFIATGEKADFVHNSNGSTATGDALVIEVCKDAAYETPNVTITGGTFTSANAKSVGVYHCDENAVMENFITGGTYSDRVSSALCAEGYLPVLNADKTWTVQKAEAVAAIGEEQYASLEDAVVVANATTGAVIDLLTDVTLTGGFEEDSEAGLYISTSVTINGNGYTIDCGTFTKGIRIYNETTKPTAVKFDNVGIVNSNNAGRCIDTRNDNIKLTLNDVNLEATGAGNNQPLTLGGYETDKILTVQFTGTNSINAGTAGYGIISFVPANISLGGNTTVDGYAGAYMKDGSAGSILTVGNNAVVTGTNNSNGESDDFGTIVIEDDNITIKSNGQIVAKANGTAQQAVIELNGHDTTVSQTNGSLVVEGENAVYLADMENAYVLVKENVKKLLLEAGYYVSPEYEDATTKQYRVYGMGGITVDGVWFDSWDEGKSDIKKNSEIVFYADQINTYNGGSVAKDFKFLANGRTITIDLNGHNFTSAKTDSSNITTMTVQYNTTVKFINSGVGGGTVTFENSGYPLVLGNNSKVYFEDGVKFVGGLQLNAITAQVCFDETALIGQDCVYGTTGTTRVCIDADGNWTLASGSLTMNVDDDATLAEKTLTISKNTTLDLAGHKLTAGNIAAFGNLIDSKDGVGTVTVSGDYYYSNHSNSNYLPLYDSENGNYRIYVASVVNKGVKVVNADTLKYGYAIMFNKAEAYLLLADMAESNDFSMNTVWTGEETGFTHEFSQDSVVSFANAAYQQMMGSGTMSKAITLNINGISDLKSGDVITTIAKLEAEVGVTITGEAYDYTLS